MKKVTFSFLIFILAFANVVKAQDDRKIRFGLSAAPSFAWLKAQEKNVKGSGLGLRFKYGLVFDYRFADYFWFGTGLEVTYLGGSLSYANPSYVREDAVTSLTSNSLVPISKAKYTGQYLEIPLTVKMKTNEINNMVYFAQVGLNAGVLLDGKAKYGSYEKIKVKGDMAIMRLAVNISGGVEYNLTNTTSLLLGLSYNNGFTNLFPGNSGYVIEDSKKNGFLTSLNTNMRSNYIALNVGFLF